jgi:hypothetical protein
MQSLFVGQSLFLFFGCWQENCNKHRCTGISLLYRFRFLWLHAVS